MRKHHLALAILTALGLGASLAAAGGHAAFPFQSGVNDGHRWVNGTFGAARSSADPTASVDCVTTGSFGYCWFVLEGVSSFCYTLDPAMLGVIGSMHDGSYFSVQWPETSAECSAMAQMTTSRAAPKGP